MLLLDKRIHGNNVMDCWYTVESLTSSINKREKGMMDQIGERQRKQKGRKGKEGQEDMEEKM